MREKLLNDLKEYKDFIKYARYTKKGLTIRFNEEKCILVKIQYPNDWLKELEKNEVLYERELFRIMLDLKRTKKC